MLLTSYEREKLRGFAHLNSDAQRDDFIRYNPQVKNQRFAIEALLVAQVGWLKKDIPMAWMYAVAAFSLGGEIQDHLLGAEAAKVASKTAPLTGNAPLERMFKASEEALRYEAQIRIPHASTFITELTKETLQRIRTNYPNVDACFDEVTTSAWRLTHSVNGLVIALDSKESASLMLSMLFLGILFIANISEVKSSIVPLNRVLALYTNNVFSVENTAQLMLCVIDDDSETQEIKRRFMATFGISLEREYNAIAIKWVIKELCEMDKTR